MHHRPLIIGLMSALPAWSSIHAADAPGNDPATQANSTDTTSSTDTTPPTWYTAIADAPLISLTDGTVHWGHGSHTFPITDIANNGDAHIHTHIGPVVVASGLVTAIGRDEAPAVLDQLITHAHASAVDGASQRLVFNDSILTGPRLWSAETIVIPEGVLHRQTTGEDPRNEQRAAVAAAAKILAQRIPDLDLPKPAAQTLQQVLSASLRPGTAEYSDEVTGAFARRLIREGWLEQVFGTMPEAAELAAVVTAPPNLWQNLLTLVQVGHWS